MLPHLPFDAPLTAYAAQAAQLDGGPAALARFYDFEDWPALTEYVASLADPAVHRFEAAIEALISGDAPALRRLLDEDPSLVHARSRRRTHFNPPVHAGTLLHYVASNGLEGYRQKAPPNLVELTRLLLEHGADPNALAGFYGGPHTPLPLLVSSCHPAQAGLQTAVAELLIDFGASVEAVPGSGPWASPLATALAFGYLDTAAMLARRGARVDRLDLAAGLGRLDEAARLLPAADPPLRHRALALAAQNGHANVVQLLLEAGEDPNRFNPDGLHKHSTPLHQAALAGHLEAARLLLAAGASLNTKDLEFHATPLGWAEHGGQSAMAEYLRSVAANPR
ncbi:MAG: ankyrin repeat domain-containing protein [Bryobacterales bacterium]|nr:ankyrin repeat domain-containing protein [Bryobacterales bacterium]